MLFFKSRSGKTSTWIAIGAVIIVLAVIGGYAAVTMMNRTIDPNKFQSFSVSGQPSEGIYTFSFLLLDERQQNGPADGTVTLTIRDNRESVLYSAQRTIKASDFRVVNDPISKIDTYVYSWDMASSNVAQGVPNPLGYGQANISFTSTKSAQFSKVASINIPTLPKIQITSLDVRSDIDDLVFGLPMFLNPIYANDIFNIDVSLITSPQVQLDNLTLTTGFTLIAVNPSLPEIIGMPGTTFTLTIRAPIQAYTGSLVIYALKHGSGNPDAGQASFVVDASNHTGAYVRNTGTKSVLLSSVYVNNNPVTLANYTVSGDWSVGTVTSINFSTTEYWTHGANLIKLVFSDNTPFEFNIVH